MSGYKVFRYPLGSMEMHRNPCRYPALKTVPGVNGMLSSSGPQRRNRMSVTVKAHGTYAEGRAPNERA